MEETRRATETVKLERFAESRQFARQHDGTDDTSDQTDKRAAGKTRRDAIHTTQDPASYVLTDMEPLQCSVALSLSSAFFSRRSCFFSLKSLLSSDLRSLLRCFEPSRGFLRSVSSIDTGRVDARAGTDRNGA